MTRRDDGPAHNCAVPYVRGRSGLPAYQDASACQGLRHSRQEGHARVADGRIQPAQVPIQSSFPKDRQPDVC